MAQHFIQQKKRVVQIKKRTKNYRFVFTIFQCGAALITCSFILRKNKQTNKNKKTKLLATATRQKHKFSDLPLRLSVDDQNIEIVTEHRQLDLTGNNKFVWQAQIEHMR